MKFNNILYFLTESLIDFSQFSLDKQVWDISNKDKPTLRKDVKDKIYKVIDNFPYFSLTDLVEEVRIIGSICTNQYLPNCDIDVHIIPKLHVLNDILGKSTRYKNKEELITDVKKYLLTKYEPKEDVFVGKHPLEFYIQLNSKQDYYSVGVYIVDTDEWKIGPKMYDMNFDPSIYFKKFLGEIKELGKEFDIQLGDLKRNLIDYDIIEQHISSIPAEYRTKFKEKLEHKLQELEDDIRTLALTKKELIDLRHNSTKDSYDKAKFDEINVKFKYIDRYMYFKLIKNLEDLIADDELTHDEVKDIKI